MTNVDNSGFGRVWGKWERAAFIGIMLPLQTYTETVTSRSRQNEHRAQYTSGTIRRAGGGGGRQHRLTFMPAPRVLVQMALQYQH